MFSQERGENVELLANGNFCLTRNSPDPPPPIKGILFKEGHIVKVQESLLSVLRLFEVCFRT
jgi:hypothetical protein